MLSEVVDERVLLVGFDPAKVDYSDPALPPGMTAEKVNAGIQFALVDIAGRGWPGEDCFIDPDETRSRRLSAVLPQLAR